MRRQLAKKACKKRQEEEGNFKKKEGERIAEIKILKLKDGEDVLESLGEFALKNSINHALIKEASGKVRDFEISGFAGKGSIENTADKSPREVLAVSGQIMVSKGVPNVHLKVSVSRPGLSAVSGLLLRGKAADSLEIAVQKSETGKIIYA